MFITLVRRSRYFLSRTFTTQIEKNTCGNFVKDLQIEALSGLDQGIVVLGLNRSKGKNSLSKSFAQHLSEALDRIYVDRNCRVVVLKSCMRGIFCPGADLKERLTLSEIEVHQVVSSLRSLMLKVQNTPIPVIAAIDGVALGGGLELALACDLRVMSKSSKVGLVETKLGIMPGAGGTQRLPRLIGPSLAKELIFTSRILDGTSAKEYGLVNHCVEDNETKDAAFLKSLEIAREIVPNGPLGVKMAKLAINKGLEVDIHNGCSFEELCYAQVVPSKDRIEGLMAFREKRPPKYKGE